MKLLLTDCATLQSNGDISLNLFKKFGETAEYENISRSRLIEEAADADIILCNKTVIDKPVLDAAKKLKLICLFATGYNNIDCETARERGIAVCNAGSYSTDAVAQQVIGYIMMKYTRIPRYDAFVKKGGWVNASVFAPLVYGSDEIAGKTLGIVGYGSIGRSVEKAALGLNMTVLVNTRTVPNDDPKFVGLNELLKRSDIVTLHCPLTADNADMMNAETFGRCKDGAFFINTARGGLVDEEALAGALKSGKLSGAAVDVLKKEPMAEDCVLLSAPNIIITPHTAWAPLATRKRLVQIVYGNVEAFLNGAPANRVV